jgi:hypothetical protein
MRYQYRCDPMNMSSTRFRRNHAQPFRRTLRPEDLFIRHLVPLAIIRSYHVLVFTAVVLITTIIGISPEWYAISTLYLKTLRSDTSTDWHSRRSQHGTCILRQGFTSLHSQNSLDAGTSRIGGRPFIFHKLARSLQSTVC